MQSAFGAYVLCTLRNKKAQPGVASATGGCAELSQIVLRFIAVPAVGEAEAAGAWAAEGASAVLDTSGGNTIQNPPY